MNNNGPTISIMKKSITITVVTLLLLVTAFGQIPSGYYDAASGKSGGELKAALYNIIKGHTTYPYTSSSTDVWDILKETDKDPNNPDNVILLYTGWSKNGPKEYDKENGWSREHVWAKSHGDFGETPPAGTDVHHLRPVDISVNSARDNKDFDNGGSRYIDGDGSTDCYTDADSWEPRDAVKGDVARMIFYMATRYEGENSEPDLEVVDYVTNWKVTPAPKYPIHGKLSTLLEWHVQDPVDDFEINRNEVIYSYQHNRNPFIDHPEYVNYIWGGNLPPMAPSGLNAPTITDTSVTLVWTDNSTDESGFRVYQNDSLVHTTAADVTEHSVSGLTPGNAYIFGVSAWNNYGESSKTTLTVVTLSDDTTADAIFFSEYIEGSSNNKSLEIINGSTKSVSLDKYCILSNANNGKWYSSHYSFPTETILNPGEVWVIAHTNADSGIINVADEVTSTTVVTFNGDDVRALVMINQTDTTFIDIIGAYRDSIYSASGWSVAGISGATADHTLIRKPGVRQGNPDWASSAGTDAANSEWILHPQDTFSYLGWHSFDENTIVEHPLVRNLPDQFRLYPCYPNPFNNMTNLAFALPATRQVTVTVFDLNGRQVDEKQVGWLTAGYHTIPWRGDKYSSGVYLYRIQAGQQIRAGKLLLMK